MDIYQILLQISMKINNFILALDTTKYFICLSFTTCIFPLKIANRSYFL